MAIDRVSDTANHDSFETAQKCVPFLKWAGGKRWLVLNHPHLFPDNYSRYIEPFLGSGAVFFHLSPNRSILSDRNSELIATYEAIRFDWRRILSCLRDHQRRHSNVHYYKTRSSNPRTPHTRAARIIYLNRTCWNGLYRVNKQGKFNVPIGTKDRVLLPTDDFEKVSALLSNTDLVACDFESTIDRATAGDLVFVDPPYTVKHNLNAFVKYNEQLFTWDDQVRLRDALVRAKYRGAHIISTNANHQSIWALYREHFDIQSFDRNSVLAASRDKRGPTQELVITNIDQ